MADPEAVETGGPEPLSLPGKSQEAKGSLRNSGTDPLEKRFGPQLLLERDSYIRPSVTEKILSGPPNRESGWGIMISE